MFSFEQSLVNINIKYKNNDDKSVCDMNNNRPNCNSTDIAVMPIYLFWHNIAMNYRFLYDFALMDNMFTQTYKSSGMVAFWYKANGGLYTRTLPPLFKSWSSIHVDNALSVQ